MGDGGQLAEAAMNVNMVSCQGICHVLSNADNSPIHELISELEDIDQEDFCVAAEELFTAACSQLNKQLKEVGIKEEPHLEQKKRQLTRGNKDKGVKALCGDIVALFHYCCKLSNTFPRDTIAATSIGRYVTIAKDIDKKEILIPPECNGGSHIMIVAQISELKEIVKAQKDAISLLTNRVKILEEPANSLQIDTAILKTSHTSKMDTSGTSSEDEIQFVFAEEQSPRYGAITQVAHGLPDVPMSLGSTSATVNHVGGGEESESVIDDSENTTHDDTIADLQNPNAKNDSTQPGPETGEKSYAGYDFRNEHKREEPPRA
jgi:hypothetical protein